MIIPTNHMVITQDINFFPGVYFSLDGLKIEDRDLSLDGNGAALIGNDNKEIGILSQHVENITLINITLQDYYWGIYIQNCAAISDNHCKISCTHEVAANTFFLDIWISKENAYEVCNNKFESYIHVIDQVGLQNTLIDGNELINNLYER